MAVVRRRSPNVFHTARKRPLDPLPLQLAQLISTRNT
jgi:hypothetical protein